MMNATLRGRPDAGNPRRGFLFCNTIGIVNVAAAAMLSVTAASGAEYVATWTGAVDNNFFHRDNWDQVPKEYCTYRFTNSVNLVYSEDIPAEKKCSYNNSYPYADTWLLDAEGITVVFGKTSFQYVSGSAPVIDVSKDSLLVVSNRLSAWNSPTRFYKKGAGTFRMHGQLMTDSAKMGRLDVLAGKMEFKRPGSSNQVGFGCTNMYVSSGAELAFVSRMTVNDAKRLAIVVATNGVVRFTDVKTYQENPLEISSISGEGEVIADGTSGDTSLKMNLDRQSAMGPFTGKMSGSMILDFLAKNNADDGQRFVLYRADALDGIRVRNGGAVVPVKGLTDATYYADGYNGTDIFRLEDADGDPADRAVNVANASSLVIKGTGNLTIKKSWDSGSVSLYQPKVSFTGNLIYDGGSTLILGDGTADNAFDLTGEGNIKGLEVQTGSTLALQGNRGDADAVAVDVPVTGSGNLYAQTTHYVFSNLNMTGNRFRAWYRAKITGGNAKLATFESGQTMSYELTVAGGRVTGGESTGSYSKSPLPTPDGVAMTGNVGGFRVGVDAGELAYGSGSGWNRMTLRGGRLWWTKSVWVGDNASIVFDGGELAADLKNEFYQYHIARNAAGITNYIGAAGGRITVLNGGWSAGVYFNPRTASLSGVTSGEFSFYGDTDWYVGTHFYLNGPVHFRDGALRVRPAQWRSNADANLFGEGETRFTDADLYFYADDWSGASPAASFATLAYDGVFGIRLGTDKVPTSAAITADALRRMSAGSMIFVATGLTGSDGASSLKVTGGVTDGAHPVVTCESGQYRFTRYDAAKGFVTVTDAECETDVTKATADRYLVIGNSVSVAQDTTVRARGAKQTYGYNVNTTLRSGSVLELGDGVNPALFLFSMKGGLLGAGSIDFGASEGVFGVAYAETDSLPAADRQCELACGEIRGQNGVSYLGWGSSGTKNRRVRVGASGKYSGTTAIAGCTVVPTVADAFSTGRVIIKPGERHGGRLRFCNAITVANDLTVGGAGSGDGNGEFDGAVCFNADATLSGDVTITEPARFSAFGGARGTLSGSVSGGRLEINTAKTDAGTVALTGANVHTGGTEVTYATLAVDSAAALGSGEVALASGTLRFENVTPTTVANELRGFGTLALTGANVSFTGPRTRLGVVALDIPGSHVTLSEIPPFVTGITNSLARKSVLHLTGAGSFAIDPAKFSGTFDIVLDAGSTLDLGGGMLTVRRFTGDRASVNGTIVETNPRAGFMMIVL